MGRGLQLTSDTNNPQDDDPKLRQAILAVSNALNADIFLLAGAIPPGIHHWFIDLCPAKPSYPTALLIIQTGGGDAHAAYGIAHCLQDRYPDGFVMCANKVCASAGTLIALGSKELVMSDHGELGPLDVQLVVRDELGARQSGLVPLQALKYLHRASFEMWEFHFLEILNRSSGQISTRTSAELASGITTGLMKELYAQLDPVRLGDTSRAMNIADTYGGRLERRSKNNVLPRTVNRLATEYPSHDYQINRAEAKELFRNVRLPSNEEATLLKLLDDLIEEAVFKSEVHDHAPPALIHLNKWAQTAPATQDKGDGGSNNGVKVTEGRESSNGGSNAGEETESVKTQSEQPDSPRSGSA